MKNILNLFFIALVVASSTLTALSQKTTGYQPVIPAASEELNRVAALAADETVKAFSAKGFKPENIAATVIDISDPNRVVSGSFRGEEKIYPASVSKMFFLVALHQWLENGRVKTSPALERAAKDMIVDSSNEATQYIVDILTGTSNGEELSGRKLTDYAFKRNIVNRYFQALGYQNIVINQKTYCEDLYGRERQFWDGGKNRNMLTTNATARLMAEIAMRKAVSTTRSNAMLELMKRDWEAAVKDSEDQTHGFTGIALKDLKLSGAKLWSKAGWTSTTRHDVAFIELPNGRKLVVAVYTTNFAKERDALPTAIKVILKEVGKL